MTIPFDLKEKIARNGFAMVENIFNEEELNDLLLTITKTEGSGPSFRKTNNLFAIRQFFKEVPPIISKIFNYNLRTVITETFGDDYFAIKSIYFDKPADSNWFVAWHQDLTIAVDNRLDLPGFGPWTIKNNQFAVQPPLHLLEDNFTIRLHLDDTDEKNGALKVIPGSHLKGIYRTQHIDWSSEKETTCRVNRGGIMFMKPLLLHSSHRTVNRQPRRVIHIEFSKCILPPGINWAEKLTVT